MARLAHAALRQRCQKPCMLHCSMTSVGMTFPLGRVLAAGLVTVITTPAVATPDDGARLPRLELRLSPGDLEPPPEQARPRGYAAVVREDPLSAIDGRSPRVGDPAQARLRTVAIDRQRGPRDARASRRQDDLAAADRPGHHVLLLIGLRKKPGTAGVEAGRSTLMRNRRLV